MLSGVWMEIPVKDIQRALKFYQAVFELGDYEISDDGVRKTAVLVREPVGVSLNQTANFEPGDKGILSYLMLGDGSNMEAALDRIEPNGGKIIEGKTKMGQDGYYAIIQDTEGNVFSLYGLP